MFERLLLYVVIYTLHINIGKQITFNWKNNLKFSWRLTNSIKTKIFPRLKKQ